MISQKTRIVSPIASDVLEGLTRTPKALPPKLFYDREGSELFEEITRLPEYYLTRTERQILAAHAAEMVALAGPDLMLVELGAGTAEKTCTLIHALLAKQRCLMFFPLDVSPDALAAARARLSAAFPRLSVQPVVADYTSGLPPLVPRSNRPALPGRRNGKRSATAHGQRKLVLYIGSSIGNFEPMQGAAILARIRRSLAPGDTLLLGTDMAKGPEALVPAYDDAAGVTARFNKNVLARINRELGGHFDLDTFRHLAVWNPVQSRMEIYLESTRDQSVAVDDLGITVEFAAGERIHTENSYKFTMPMIASLLTNGGFALEHTWTDSRQWFALHLARVR